ncbi:hypothetical protein GGI35DRAFT_465458 [Trichoderma velutinum]
MSLPEALGMSREQISGWRKTAPKDICDPEFLQNCCQQLNTAEMLIVGAEEFYDNGINLAKGSKDGDDFMYLLKQFISQRRAKLTEWYTELLQNARSENCESSPRDIGRDKVVEFFRNPSLETLRPILNSALYGWEAEECLLDGAPIEPPSDDGSNISSTQRWNEEDLCHSHMTPSDTSDDLDVTIRPMSKAPSEASEASTIESYGAWRRKRASRCEQYTTETPVKKRRRSDDATGADDAEQPDNKDKKRRFIEEETSETESPTNLDEAVASGRRIEKRAGDHNDYNDGRRHKCRKIRRQTSAGSDFPTSVIVSENAQAVAGNIPRERSKTDDGDNNNEGHRHKRRRRETQESTPMLHISPLTQQSADESITVTTANFDDEVGDSQSESRRRTSSRPVLHEQETPLPTDTLKTRSMTRAEPTAFYELDDTSNRREILTKTSLSNEWNSNEGTETCV